MKTLLFKLTGTGLMIFLFSWTVLADGGGSWRADIYHSSSMYLHNQDGTPGAVFFTLRTGSNGFSDRDFAIWEIIQSHLSNYFSTTQKLQLLKAQPIPQPDILTRTTQHFFPIEFISGHKLLSKREAEVTTLLCQRLTVPEIASRLAISPHTVRTYVENIKEKLNVHNRRELLVKMRNER